MSSSDINCVSTLKMIHVHNMYKTCNMYTMQFQCMLQLLTKFEKHLNIFTRHFDKMLSQKCYR